MQLHIRPGRPLRGTVRLPGDKSLSHRAALFAALAEGTSVVENFLVSGVTRAMLDGLTALGVPWRLEGNCLQVEGRGWQSLRGPTKVIDCGNSATTMRMLAGAVSAAGVACILDGSEGLRRRPMDRIIEPLRKMGVPISMAAGGGAPLLLEQRNLSKRLCALNETLAVASAQVKTCLLLAGLAADGETTVREPGPSRDHTERMLRSMGCAVKTRELPGQVFETILTPPTTALQPIHAAMPGDISAAAFLMVAAVITPGSEVRLEGIGLNPTRTGLIDALAMAGAKIDVLPGEDQAGEPIGDIVVRSSRLIGTEIHGSLVVRMIDEFPALAVVAAFANGDTFVRDAEELRWKESDRIGRLCEELSALGAAVEEYADGFTIHGGHGHMRGGDVHPHGDHRLAMALAVSGLASKQGVTVQGAEIIQESFPTFVETLRDLGADIQTWQE